jgi:hypothetical protein
MRPDIGWELAVVAQCAHSNLTDHTDKSWVLERVPLPPDRKAAHSNINEYIA